MRRLFVCAALAAALAAPLRAQFRVENSAPEGTASVRAVAPVAGPPVALSGFQSLLSAPTLSAPSAPAAESRPAADAADSSAAFPAAAAPAPLPASAASPAAAVEAAPETAAAAPDEAAPAAQPRDWDFSRWRESLPEENASTWKFRGGWLASARLWDGWRRAPLLGAGAMGTVFVHPWDSDRVVKVARRGYKDAAGQFFAPDDETVLSYEDFDLARLAAIGAAPRPLSRLTVSGRPASARERVRGFTVAQLKRRGAYGARERALTHDLLSRIADGGFVARDLNLGNIVIGRVRGSDERAWLVDALGVSARGDLDAAGRKAEMLAERVPWITFQGFGLTRPLAKTLDAGLGARSDYEKKPIAWSRWARWPALAALLGILAAAPPLIRAAPLAAPLSLGLLHSWPALAAVAALIGLAGIPLRLFAHRLAPWVMTWRRDAGDQVLRRGPFDAVPELAVSAVIEELVFRAGLFLAGAALLHSFLPLVPALVAASFLSSMIFALIHGYGSVWTRVVGGLLYCGAFVVSGSLLLPIAAHFAFNLSLYVHGRYLR